MRTALLCVITQQVMVISFQCSGTDTLSPVGKKLQQLTV